MLSLIHSKHQYNSFHTYIYVIAIAIKMYRQIFTVSKRVECARKIINM